MTIKEKQKTTKRLHSSVLLVVLLVFLIFIVLQMAAEFCQNFSWKCLQLKFALLLILNPKLNYIVIAGYVYNM